MLETDVYEWQTRYLEGSVMTKPDRLSQQTACDKNHTREEEQLARV
jgi:hypothetical protein